MAIRALDAPLGGDRQPAVMLAARRWRRSARRPRAGTSGSASAHHGGQPRRRASAAAARCRHCRAGWRRRARRRRRSSRSSIFSASPSISVQPAGKVRLQLGQRGQAAAVALDRDDLARRRRARRGSGRRGRGRPRRPCAPSSGAGNGGDPRQQLAVEDEILAERLGRRQPVAGDDVAQRLRVGAAAHPGSGRNAAHGCGHADRRGHRARVGAVLRRRCRTRCHGRARCGRSAGRA